MLFFKRHVGLKDSGIFKGFTDWHSHILPGVDDGVQTMDEALYILALYEKLGVKAVWLTPHIMEDVPNTIAHLMERFDELRTAYKGDIELYLAAEYMLDNLFYERLNNDDLLLLGQERNMLLVETSYFNPPANMHSLLEKIKFKGFYPVLAHPERYLYMDTENYKKLRVMGVKFQLNLFSMEGLYGKEAQRKARWLAKKGYYDMTGTDLHSRNTLTNVL